MSARIRPCVGRSGGYAYGYGEADSGSTATATALARLYGYGYGRAEGPAGTATASRRQRGGGGVWRGVQGGAAPREENFADYLALRSNFELYGYGCSEPRGSTATASRQRPIYGYGWRFHAFYGYARGPTQGRQDADVPLERLPWVG